MVLEATMARAADTLVVRVAAARAAAVRGLGARAAAAAARAAMAAAWVEPKAEPRVAAASVPY